MEVREFFNLDEDLLAKIGRLRIEAWETETARAAEQSVWVDECDRVAWHWVVFRDGLAVAAARLSLHGELAEMPESECYEGVFSAPPKTPIASLNRLVVHPSARGSGISRRLDLIRLEAAERLGARVAILSTASGPRRLAQLLGLGFVFLGHGSGFKKPPLCYVPKPAVLFCELPRVNSIGLDFVSRAHSLTE
jgi:GNAT superfamily N-acetyltransferase